jgi:DNA-binding transcriptional ArsR family regulator
MSEPRAISARRAGRLAELFEAIGHPRRLRALVAVRDAGTSGLTASEHASELDLELGVVAYHFRTLFRDALIKAIRQEARRGALATFYTLTPQGERLLAEIADLDRRRPSGS